MKFRLPVINSKLIIEFVSITFAVLLALMVNQYKDNRSNKILVKKTLANIRTEIEENKSTVEEMMAIHQNSIHLLDAYFRY